MLTLVFLPPGPARADVNVQIGIPLPPAILFPAPPALIVIPETNVYTAPDLDEEIFFYQGWWWRPWNGNWYRSRHFQSAWTPYPRVPSFYRKIPATWRDDYRHRRWKGHHWNTENIPRHQIQNRWREWEREKHWQSQNYWGVRDLSPRTHNRESYPHSPAELRKPGRRGPEFHEDRAYGKSGRPEFPDRPHGNPAGWSKEKRDNGKRFDH